MNNEKKCGKVEPVREGAALELRLSGDYTLGSAIPNESELLAALDESVSVLRLTDAGIADWDSFFLMLLTKLRGVCVERSIELDLTGLPSGVQRMVALAQAVPDRSGTKTEAPKRSFVYNLGLRALKDWAEFLSFLTFLGEATVALMRFFTGRARYRRSDLWVFVQDCGPKALPIVTVISVLVGAILAFVGAIQLKMFGAEIYVANLVGLGMVIEMGALMTGIILSGRTGAAFAAQLGTMQVNEEIDALVTMGISPMEYLVLPRMISLAVMTPLLVIFANALGIFGGVVVGVLLLDISPKVFLDQAFSMLTLWHCAQGLIKGCTFGIIVALSGCLRGMQCGRSASAVGDAATAAVVTSIVAIVLSDAVWTCIFMIGGK